MIQTQPSVSRPRNPRAPVPPRRPAVMRRSAASRPDLSEVSRWKVQLELAPSEIAFVYRKGLARGAEVCRRGTHEWRPLVTTPELREALAARASLAEMIEQAPPPGSALTLSQTLAISDPSLSALMLAQRSTHLPKSTPPPPPPAVGKSTPPGAALAPRAAPTSTLVNAETLPALRQPKPLINRDSVPDWEDTPLLPVRILPPPVMPRLSPPIRRQVTPPTAQPLSPTEQVLSPTTAQRLATLPSLRARADQPTEPVIVHARPIELWLSAAVAVVVTLLVTAVTLRAEAPRLNALISTNARPVHPAPRAPRPAAPARDSAPSAIPIVYFHDLPVEGGRVTSSSASTSPQPSQVTSRGAAAPHGAPSAGPDRASLARALGSAAAAARSCGDGPVSAQVVVTFGPSGVARNIHFSAPPPVALRSCVLNAVARTHVAPFSGEPVTVSKTLRW